LKGDIIIPESNFFLTAYQKTGRRPIIVSNDQVEKMTGEAQDELFAGYTTKDHKDKGHKEPYFKFTLPKQNVIQNLGGIDAVKENIEGWNFLPVPISSHPRIKRDVDFFIDYDQAMCFINSSSERNLGDSIQCFVFKEKILQNLTIGFD
jgi:hypothetical protein